MSDDNPCTEDCECGWHEYGCPCDDCIEAMADYALADDGIDNPIEVNS